MTELQGENLSCVDCGVKACREAKGEKKYPDFCVTKKLSPEKIKEVISWYEEEENHKVTIVSASIESDFYLKYTRVEETIEFAKRLGAKKIGIATCSGLLKEASVFAKLLRKNGFEVYGICCKVGAIPKVEVGIETYSEKTGPNMCNPILQAKLLNEAGTDLNVVIGLCVGHDSLFYKYSEALTTTLISKDRVTGHNPAAVLYNIDSFYKRLMKE